MEQRVLGGRYLLKDKVGTGGMATVYRAQDQVLDRTVAVKIMLPQYAGDATFAARFKQEAQAAAGLSSPYIVGVYDWGKDGDTYYIVMEYLRGTDLKSGIKSHGALDPKKVAQIGSQISSALSVAHKHEIIHRDIKPQNIMVLPDGNIKVMDFGIARAKNSHLTQDNNVLGTAHYVSPEQTRGQDLGPTSDIYSLGVVMYECATGRVLTVMTPSRSHSSRSTSCLFRRARSTPVSTPTLSASSSSAWRRTRQTASRPLTSCVRCSTATCPVVPSTSRSPRASSVPPASLEPPRLASFPIRRAPWCVPSRA